ncbi:unnamed protein product [Caenorhabditis sp. 36 PRJEB53466]|nr:unnamed protein product [Caenorhabditis sp. 36 PRJEB53466]
MANTYMDGEIFEETANDTSMLNATVIVDTWNGTTTTGITTISPEREKLYESLVLSGSAITFILLGILIFYFIKTSRWYRQWWNNLRSEKSAKRAEKARLKAKAEREKEDEEDEEEYSV